MSEVIGVVLKTLMVLLGLGGVLYIGNSAFQNNKNANHLSEVSMLAANVQAAVQSGTFTNLTTASVIAGSKGDTLAPGSLISGNNMINPWNGSVTVGVDPTNASQFVITTTDLPNGGCAKVASGVSAKKVTINGTVVTVPVDEPTARSACNQAENTLAITFTH